MKKYILKLTAFLSEGFTIKRTLIILLGTAVTSFGIYNIHRQTGITEGGILGLLLLLEHWFAITPSKLTLILDFTCYLIALRYLGKQFLKFSLFSTFCLSCFFRLWEAFPPLLPDLSGYPLLAAVLGAIFIGAGVGLVVSQGGSCGGDDALALTISHITRWRISCSYLITDVAVLLLSLSYIPLYHIFFSLITVTISSYLVDRVQRIDILRKQTLSAN